MRQFSDFEEDILKEIVSEKPDTYVCNGVSYASYALAEIITMRLGVINMNLNKINGWPFEVTFIDKDGADYIPSLFDFFFLIKYLEKYDLLGLSPLEKQTRKEYTSERYEVDVDNKWKTEKEGKWTEIPTKTVGYSTSLGEDILRYADSYYYPSQELKDLVANNFKSNEQIYVETQLDEAKTQTQYARRSVIWAIVTGALAFLTFLATIVIPLITK